MPDLQDFVSREPSPKRRRLDSNTDDHSSPTHSSADELAPSSPSQPTSPRLRSFTHRRSTEISTSTPTHDRDDSQEESPDELDHTFTYHPTKQVYLRHPPSIPSTTQDSPAAEIPSSPVPTPEAEPEPSQPEDTRPRLNFKPKLILRGHKRGVCAVKFSPDGQWIASCCEPNHP